MKKNDYYSLKFENDFLFFLNQTKLPFVEEYIKTDKFEVIAQAIEKLEIRGAPLIGIAAAFALSISIKEKFSEELFFKAFNRLKITRPTAVNLFWALNIIKDEFELNKNVGNVYKILVKKSNEIFNKEINSCKKIAENGIKVFKKKSNVLTHCNTGRLVSSGNGTALNILVNAFENELLNFVYVDETRPLLQGSRLTAFELWKNKIPFSIQTDSTAAFLFQQKKIDLVITGADRIARNGDTANKVGTYNLAVLCKFHKIPFYIAAPVSTIDKNISDGKKIIIEERNSKEITAFHKTEITNDKFPCYNPAFDVTPAKLISGIITEEGIFNYPYSF